ncbi:uncharacterized protein F4822DRAFT_16952 [Hypoxylon trugodes]|uniref:uncharacterized protein n=1 Tax=Hypoxylon trugodes TaxID=326681 RepID=UPI0021933745|nr:uncharacterized protein F4822DRAFT_16952 [Hypoxylon trugodes]KAI1393568.1 hypothetical protein F4822DRAFT_16952 [Hypoxylon trugodes]
MPSAQQQDLAGMKTEQPANTKNVVGKSQEKPSTGNGNPQEPPKPGEEEKEPPRDSLTGRTLADDGGCCLRCTEKGLRCTLMFLGIGGEDKCSACRRNKAKYCFRLQAPSRRIGWRGPPWKNPNFFTIGEQPTREEMEQILRDHYLGEETWRHGMYINEAERNSLALPPYNGTDRPLDERPENWKSVNWQHVLPTWENRSLKPRPFNTGEGEFDDGIPIDHGFLVDGTLEYMRARRGYEPRTEHLSEYMDLGETW